MCDGSGDAHAAEVALRQMVFKVEQVTFDGLFVAGPGQARGVDQFQLSWRKAEARRMRERLGASPEPAIKRSGRSSRGGRANMHPPDPINSEE